jgi:hypothetical protein
MRDMVAQRLEQAQRADGDDLGGVFRNVERDLDMALGAEVIDLVGVDAFQHAAQTAAIGQVAVMQRQLGAALVRVMVQVVDPVGIEQARPADDAVDLVAFAQQEFGQIRTVLPGDPGDQRLFCHAAF